MMRPERPVSELFGESSNLGEVHAYNMTSCASGAALDGSEMAWRRYLEVMLTDLKGQAVKMKAKAGEEQRGRSVAAGSVLFERGAKTQNSSVLGASGHDFKVF